MFWKVKGIFKHKKYNLYDPKGILLCTVLYSNSSNGWIIDYSYYGRDVIRPKETWHFSFISPTAAVEYLKTKKLDVLEEGQ